MLLAPELVDERGRGDQRSREHTFQPVYPRAVEGWCWAVVAVWGGASALRGALESPQLSPSYALRRPPLTCVLTNVVYLLPTHRKFVRDPFGTSDRRAGV